MTGPGREIVDRPYISPWFLWTAEHHAALARRIEEARPKDQRHPWIEHRAYVLSSILMSAHFVEAVVNELFQDVADRGDGLLLPADFLWLVTAPLAEDVQDRMRAYWKGSNGGRRPTLAKYDELLELADRSPLDPKVRANAGLVLDVRNTIVHYRPRDHFTAQRALELEKKLKSLELDPNPLVGPAPRAFWMEHALGSGLARWATKAAVALTDATCEALEIEPNYASHKGGSWFEMTPGDSELFCPPDMPS